MDNKEINEYLKKLEVIHTKKFKDDKDYLESCKTNKDLSPKDYKIQSNHKLDEYFNKYGKKLGNGKLLVYKKDELWMMNKDTKYWEINNDSEFKYFEIPSKKIIAPLFVPNVVLFGLIAATLAFAGLFTWKALSNSTGGNDDPVTPIPDPDPYDYVPVPTDSIAITAVSEDGAEVVLRTSQASLQGANSLYKSSDDYYFEEIADTTDVTIDLEYKETLYLYRPSTAKIGTRLLDLEQGYGEIALSGNIKSMIGNSATMPDDAFSYLFGGNNIAGYTPIVKVMSAKKIILPYTTLSASCYSYMFVQDEWLIDYPELPATTLASSCYSSMFQNCRSLVRGPDLPATIAKDYCYNYMFSKCYSLTTTPRMIIDTGAPFCCFAMFNACTSLNEFPEDFKLATDFSFSVPFVGNCFMGMFSDCTALDHIPEDMIRSTKLTCIQIYQEMFSGCTGLTSIPPNLFKNITTIANLCFNGMFSGCTGIEEIPEGLFSSITSFDYNPTYSSFKATECFGTMFQGCTSLKTVPYNLLPSLPITSDNSRFFYQMFYNCTALTSTPKLLEFGTYPPTFYSTMFSGCTSLNVGECNSEAEIPAGGKKIISTPSSFDTTTGQCPFGHMFNNANCSFTSLDGQGTPNPSKTYYFY